MDTIVFIKLDTVNAANPLTAGEEVVFYETHVALHQIMAISEGLGEVGAGVLLTDGTLLASRQTVEEILEKLDEIARRMGGLE